MALTQVSTGGIKDATVATADIADDAVTTAKIAAGAVGNTEIADNAISTTKINGGAVNSGALGTGVVTTAKIADDAVTGDKISNNLDISDNNKIRFGSSQDFQLFHESSSNDNIIDCATTRPLRVRFGGSNQFEFLSGGGVKMNDGRKVILGDSSDLQIYHSGAASIVANSGTGDLYLQDDGNVIIGKITNAEVGVKVIGDGAVELYHDNVKKLETTSSGATVTGTVVADNTAGRNIIINGDMRVAQRATSASFDDHGSEIEVCDRWTYNRHGVTATVAQVAEAPAGSGFKNSLKWTSTSAVSGSLHAGNVLKYIYKVETQDIQRLGYGSSNGKTATLSFWAKGSLAGKIGISFVRDSKVFSANVDMTANTWEHHEVVIPVDTSTAFSAGDTATGFQIGICWGAGSNSTSGTANEWINYHNAYTGGFTANQQGAYLTTSGSTFQITGVQLEIGSKATPFAHRPIAEEIALCERYYQALVIGGSQYFANGYYLTDTTVYGVVTHRTRMRAAPTLYQTTGTDYYYIYRHGSGDSFTGFDVFHWKNGISGNFRVVSGVSSTSGTAGGLYTAENNARIAFDAEL